MRNSLELLSALQGIQSQIEPYVPPAVLSLGGLLIFLLVVYAGIVWYHVHQRRRVEDLREKWKGQVEDYLSADGEKQNLEVTPSKNKFLRDFLVDLTRKYPDQTGQLRDLYRRRGFLKRDISQLSSRRWAIRAGALNRLRAMQAERAKKFLPQLLRDPRLEVQLVALATWGSLGSHDIEVDLPKTFLKHSELLDQFICIKLFPARLPVEELAELADREEPRLRRAAAILLGRSGEENGLDVLEALISDPIPEIRRQAALAAGRTGSPKAIQILQDAKSDPDPQVRAALAESLGKIQYIEAVGPLEELAEDPDLKVQVEAFLSLSNYGAEGREVINLFRDKSPKLAREATQESYFSGASAR